MTTYIKYKLNLINIAMTMLTKKLCWLPNVSYIIYYAVENVVILSFVFVLSSYTSLFMITN